MRTTLDIDDDVLHSVKEFAAREGISAGKFLSRVARIGLLRGEAVSHDLTVRNGVVVFPPVGDEVICLDLVQKLMDEEGI